MATQKTGTPKKNIRKKFWQVLGPGLITGASDDDPSGIATYSQAGAKFGMKLLWTALFTYPLMVAIQQMCARIGLVTGHGLTGIIKRYYSRRILYLVLVFSLPSIILNIGADVAGMGAVANLIVPKVPAFAFSIFFTILLMYCIVFFSYRKITTILKWLCIVLFSYIIIPFLTHPDWKGILKNTFIPSFENSIDYMAALVGILGTTISPYLFFWQTSMEVEEVRQHHLVIDKAIMSDMRTDVNMGIIFSNLVFYFIILATGSVLFQAGIHQINTVEEAAMALKPLAGNMAYALFAIGVIGIGLLAVPVLAGSLSYMIAETFGWEEGIDKKWWQAKKFYLVLVIILVSSLLINFVGISPVKALLYAAILYGMTAPVLIAVILHICNNKKIMGEYTNNRWNNVLGAIALVTMTTATGFLIYLFFR
jgi:NRAMP (natural resistance-associated macrophage protein)-like metal ion transporter